MTPHVCVCVSVSGSRRSASAGVVRAMGDSYFLSADVSGFEPQEVVVLAYNQCVVIQAEKVCVYYCNREVLYI